MNEFKVIDIIKNASNGNGVNLADSLSGISIYDQKISLLFFSEKSLVSWLTITSPNS